MLYCHAKGPRISLCYMAIMSLFLVVGCGCSDSRVPGSSQKLVVYSTHGKDLLAEFERLFEESHPGQDVAWLDMGSQDVLDRLRAERANPQADLWWGAPSNIFDNAAKENLLTAYRPSWAEQVGDEYKHPQDFWYGTFKTPEVIIYNSQELTPETAPRDWDDFLDPQWRNKVILRSPLASGTMRTIFCAMIWRFYRDTGSPEEGYRWLSRLDANTKEYTADSNIMMQMLTRGAGNVGLWTMPDVELYRVNYGYPVDFIIPASGTPVVTDAIAIVAGAKNPEGAKTFYEYVTSTENLVLQAQKFHRIPTRNDIPKEKLPDWMRNLEIKEMPVDWQLFAEKGSEWMRYWDENIKGRGKQ